MAAEEPMDYTTDPPTPITPEYAKEVITELSQKAQKAELEGDQILANFIHDGINDWMEHL
ncbi:hypothetical protein [Streptomyces sp. NPDC059883]|uniref:hypothetical protein n=1 Tax=unclassified Streptomyces TaxID=2593676 RepID=UPI00364D90B6